MYSVTKAAQLIKVHPNTIRNAIKTEKLLADPIENLTGFTYSIGDFDLFHFWYSRKHKDATYLEIKAEYAKLTKDGSEEGAWLNE